MAVGHDDRRDRRVVDQRGRDRSEQQVFQHAVPAGADDEDVGVQDCEPDDHNADGCADVAFAFTAGLAQYSLDRRPRYRMDQARS